MASTYSPNLQIQLIGPGDQSGAWGDTTNYNLGTLVEQAISGGASFNCTGGTDTIGAMTPGVSATARNMYLTLNGTGGGTVTCPTNAKLYFVFNNTSGAITFKTVSGTGISIPAGSTYALYCNGTNVVNATSSNGAVSYFPGTPSGSPVGLTTAAGTASTFMRSDATLAIDTSITPTWTGTQTFTNQVFFTSGVTLSGSVSGTGITNYFSSPTAIGNTSPNTGAFTNVTANIASFKKAYTQTISIGTISTALVIDASLSNVFTCTTTAANNISTVTINNFSDGQTINILITQSASGNSQITATAWAKWPGGPPAVVLTQSNAAKDLLIVTNIGGVYYATVAKAFS
jgi:hypothetical protein